MILHHVKFPFKAELNVNLTSWDKLKTPVRAGPSVIVTSKKYFGNFIIIE